MLDLKKPVAEYGRTPFLVGAFLCFIGALLAFCVKKPAGDQSVETIPLGSSV